MFLNFNLREVKLRLESNIQLFAGECYVVLCRAMISNMFTNTLSQEINFESMGLRIQKQVAN